jgi:hypothetical protein
MAFSRVPLVSSPLTLDEWVVSRLQLAGGLHGVLSEHSEPMMFKLPAKSQIMPPALASTVY